MSAFPGAFLEGSAAAALGHTQLQCTTDQTNLLCLSQPESAPEMLAPDQEAAWLQAQMAYLAGNKAQAKQLSTEGRAANERMHAAHAAAAAAIYRQRNPSGAAWPL